MAKADLVSIFEPTARSLFGHHFHYCIDAARALTKEGYQAEIHVAAQADISDFRRLAPEIEVHPTFHFRYSQAFERAHAGIVGPHDHVVRRAISYRLLPRLRAKTKRVEDENRAYRRRAQARAIESLFPRTESENETLRQAALDWSAFFDGAPTSETAHHLFFPTGEYFVLLSLIQFLEAGHPVGVRSIHVRLWNFISLEVDGAGLIPLARRLGKLAKARGIQTHWYSETPWGQKRLSRALGRPADYLDINSFRQLPTIFEQHQYSRKNSDDHPYVIFPGGVRRFPDKGIDFVADLAEQAAKDRPFEIRLQEIADGIFDEERSRLAASGIVRFLPRLMGGDAYASSIQNAMAVVLPYDGVTWVDSSRGSGVVLEALLYKRPVYVRTGSPLTLYARHFDIPVFRTPKALEMMLRKLMVGQTFVDVEANYRRYAAMILHNDLIRNLALG